MINTHLYQICREPAHRHHCATTMLVALHLLIDIVCYYAPSVHCNAYYISELLLIGCLLPVYLHLTSSQYISLEFTAKLVQGVDLHSICKKTQAIKILYHNVNTVIRFGSWSLAICCLVPKFIYLPSDLILCTRLMLGYLESRFSKVRFIIVQQGSSICPLYQCNKFRCRWSRPPVEVLSVGIKLFQLGPKTASSFGF
jgi:hypothetical protein